MANKFEVQMAGGEALAVCAPDIEDAVRIAVGYADDLGRPTHIFPVECFEGGYARMIERDPDGGVCDYGDASRPCPGRGGPYDDLLVRALLPGEHPAVADVLRGAAEGECRVRLSVDGVTLDLSRDQFESLLSADLGRLALFC